MFPLKRHWRAADMIRADLEDADVSVKDESGRVLDFHALRKTFGTNLARGAVSLQHAQKLLRHQDPALTANVYTGLNMNDERGAVAALPDLDAPVEETGKLLGSLLGREKHAGPDDAGHLERLPASKLASPAGLEPATPGLGNRFRPESQPVSC